MNTITPMDNDAYHADVSAVSKSMLSTFRQRPRLYQAEYINRTAPPRKPSAAMELGTLAHAALLEPHKLADLYATYPREVLSSDGKATTTAAKAFAADHEAAGRIVLRRSDFAKVEAMVDSVRRVVGDWLAMPARKEHAVYWNDEATGIRCKCKPDWLIERGGTAFVLDVKTTADASPQAFRKSCENFDYWLQHAHYTDGVTAATRLQTEFYFVAVESEFPYACAMYQLDIESAVRARLARDELMAQLQARYESGDWSDPWDGKITPLEIRRWCFDGNQ